MKHKGFLKLYRSILSKPGIAELVSDEGAVGFGVYMMIVLYLSQCDDYEGCLTNGQLQILADQARKSRAYIRHIIEGYGLFVIEGKRFHESFINQYSPARKNRYAREEIEIDIEKENKEKSQACVILNDTQPEVKSSPVGPSHYEMVDRDGKRHGGRGELVPWWAPPQMDVYSMWSMQAQRWVAVSQYDSKTESQLRSDRPPEDFMMKTAWEKLDESEHNRIQDYARRK